MFEAAESREIAVNADTVWELLADWSATRWLPGAPEAELVRSGDRITRRLPIPGADPIEETLLATDPATMTLHYRIAASEKFPLKDYSGTAIVRAADGGCRVEWQCRFDQGEMSDEKANAIASRNLNVLLDCLASYLEHR